MTTKGVPAQSPEDLVEVPNGPGIIMTREKADLHGLAYKAAPVSVVYTEDDVERVAKAMWENPGSHGDERVPWDQVPGLIARGAFNDVEGKPYDPRDGHRSDARAALGVTSDRRDAALEECLFIAEMAACNPPQHNDTVWPQACRAIASQIRSLMRSGGTK